MGDMLIRGVSDEVLTAINARAAKLGLSRAEYVRRRLAQDVAFPAVAVTLEDLQKFAGAFADLANSDTLAEAWD
jgi:plasmid stability protein